MDHTNKTTFKRRIFNFREGPIEDASIQRKKSNINLEPLPFSKIITNNKNIFSIMTPLIINFLYPLKFLIMNIFTILIAIFHIISVSTITWFSSHWNEQIELFLFNKSTFLLSLNMIILFSIVFLVWTITLVTISQLIKLIISKIRHWQI